MENTQETQPEVVQENGVSNNKKYIIIAIISVVVLLALFAAGYFLVKYYKGRTAINAREEVKAPKVLSGTLLMSVLPIGAEGGVPLTVAVEASSSISTYIYNDVMQSDKLYVTQSSLSPNKKFYVTGGMPMDGDPSDAGNSISLYSGKFNGFFVGIKPENIVAKFGTAKDAKALMFRGPSVGDHGGVLYAAPAKGNNELNFNWEIHYAAQNADMVVAYGLNPKWVSPSEFVYATKAGIRIHNLTAGTDDVVDVLIGGDGKPFPVQLNMTIGVSRDGKQIAFTNPEEYTVYLFNRDGDRFVLRKSFRAHGFWPTFSPDGKILALQTVKEISQIKKNPDPVLNFYDIESENPSALEKNIDLGAYRNEVLFINDWY